MYEKLSLPIKDKNGIFIRIGDRLKISFGTGTVKYIHKDVEVYFNEDNLQVCVRGGNITSKAFPIPLTGYVNPEYEILEISLI